MGNYFKSPPKKILMTGPRNSGKTTILEGLKLGEITTTIPQIGEVLEIVEFEGFELINFVQ